MGITRRIFMKNGAMTVVGMAAVPEFLARAAMAAEAGPGHKRLVVIFQRGAADGLNIVVPHGDAAYYAMRPTIAIPKSEVIDLDGFFGLHPAMSALQPLWDERHLAMVHAAGSPDPTRSHFDAQDFMESGTPGVKTTQDGWLNRALLATTPATGTGQQTALRPQAPAFRAVALGTALPRMLSGSAPALAMGNVNDFGVAPRNPQAQPLANTFESMYAGSVDAVLHGTAQETFDAVKMLKASVPANYRPAAGVIYPKGRFADALKQTAQLVKANLGVQVAFTDIGGWDNHVNEGGSQGQLANLLKEFSGSLAAFWQDLGPLAEETVVVTMSEFGRTARENGNRGTDHGHANVMFVMGGGVRGGKVYGRWPGLANEQLYEQRDLALSTDFRQVLAEAVARQLGDSQLGWPRLESVFPGFRNPGVLHLLG
jgi:uncharacterized protein (DUF1501 family)